MLNSISIRNFQSHVQLVASSFGLGTRQRPIAATSLPENTNQAVWILPSVQSRELSRACPAVLRSPPPHPIASASKTPLPRLTRARPPAPRAHGCPPPHGRRPRAPALVASFRAGAARAVPVARLRPPRPGAAAPGAAAAGSARPRSRRGPAPAPGRHRG